MKTYQAVKPGKGSYIEVETPVPKDDEILVKVRYCGVCGTDYALFSGN
ncbi:MAG: alcohol dehydrogenase catalytic domain-containing protein, partial [Clostridia bacterium]|nr:alcohol dehydrogenase catalytic domain-containing protein [Clostridia bacterium]